MPFSGEVRAQVVLLFGPPGSGKGTIGSMICAAGNHFHLSSGEIFRRLSPESANGQLFHDYAARGKLVPDEVTVAIWQRYTQGLIDTNRYFPGQQLLMLDGIPRTERQVELLHDYIDVRHIIVLEVDDHDVLVQRIQRRAKIEKRLDDADPQVIRTRIEEFVRQTARVLDRFPAAVVSRYDARQTPVEVLRDVLVGSAEILKAMPNTMPRRPAVELEKPPIAPDQR